LQAKQTGLFAAIAVSSDSPHILAAAKESGADIAVARPSELATDVAPKIPAMLHCLLEVERQFGYEFRTYVDLDATSPLRLPSDIAAAVDLLETRGASNVISGAPARRSPYFNLVEENTDGFVGLSKSLPGGVVRRQDAPRCFDMNASIYVWHRDIFVRSPSVFYKDSLLYQMPEERSIDIDSELDFEIVEFLMRKRDAGY
jgi:N-acylneuraminate cytidylyltransferase/CMP-N,N'-diacetyllegionaminic acid synthase